MRASERPAIGGGLASRSQSVVPASAPAGGGSPQLGMNVALAAAKFRARSSSVSGGTARGTEMNIKVAVRARPQVAGATSSCIEVEPEGRVAQLSAGGERRVG